MELKFHSPVLITNNLERLSLFYTGTLNLSVELDFGACILLKCGLSLWQLSEEHKIAKHLGYRYNPKGNKNLELCFETDNFNETIDKLKKGKPELLHDVTEETWGQKTIRFYDPDKNLIEIGETIPCFIRRMHTLGMTVEEIVAKTSVPKNSVQKYIKG